CSAWDSSLSTHFF
nr:immunoglobulin light chain junction region [Macaca mulatta]MPO11223.1 immunoglobulin light chain junction region [Macaca mulatta]MPO11741.1 immunoglobulin light chain junction region [Macaca mulatta]MPO14240.1 immunoglobulin light chain junction region [Macaca mulatta]